MSTLTLGSHLKVAPLGLAVAALVLTSGCATGGSGPADGAEVNPEAASETANEGAGEETGEAPGDSGAPSAAEGRVQSTSGSSGSAEIDSGDVLASATIDSAVGGTVTATVRSVEVSGETMTVRWAVGWEDPAQPSDATGTVFDLIGAAHPVTTVTDTENLKAYKPLCTEGSWLDAGAASQSECEASMLASPLDLISSGDVRNGGVLEGSATLPALEDDVDSVTVTIMEGTPALTNVPVTLSGES